MVDCFLSPHGKFSSRHTAEVCRDILFERRQRCCCHDWLTPPAAQCGCHDKPSNGDVNEAKGPLLLACRLDMFDGILIDPTNGAALWPSGPCIKAFRQLQGFVMSFNRDTQEQPFRCWLDSKKVLKLPNLCIGENKKNKYNSATTSLKKKLSETKFCKSETHSVIGKLRISGSFPSSLRVLIHFFDD